MKGLFVLNMSLPDCCADCYFEKIRVSHSYCWFTNEDLLFDENGKHIKEFDFTIERSPRCPLREIEVEE